MCSGQNWTCNPGSLGPAFHFENWQSGYFRSWQSSPGNSCRCSPPPVRLGTVWRLPGWGTGKCGCWWLCWASGRGLGARPLGPMISHCGSSLRGFYWCLSLKNGTRRPRCSSRTARHFFSQCLTFFSGHRSKAQTHPPNLHPTRRYPKGFEFVEFGPSGHTGPVLLAYPICSTRALRPTHHLS